MNTSALLAFMGILLLFVLVTLYIFSRLRAIRVEQDVARLAMSIHLTLSGVTVLITLLFLFRP